MFASTFIRMKSSPMQLEIERTLGKITTPAMPPLFAEAGKESTDAGLVVDDSKIDFTIRYCKRATALTSTGYRVQFESELYDILAVDHMNFKRKCIKLSCQKVRR